MTLDLISTLKNSALTLCLLITTIVVLICCISRINHSYWGPNVCLNINICKCLVSNYTNMSNFQPLQVVDRDSETQLQVAENLNPLI